ncbi:rRNA maturation RNase YbeY, partial [Stenotrophomonas maltophilia]|uniref:rRNA maturation RNase YbeY n=1 Tax=Stenotrophomonas maltophilia TaxID=40324 RepID=UPI003BF8BF18
LDFAHPAPFKLRSLQMQCLGDIVICPEIAERNAKLIGQSLGYEVCFLITHGILHLCGHDHENPSDERKMLMHQRRIMKTLVARLSKKNLDRLISPRRPRT